MLKWLIDQLICRSSFRIKMSDPATQNVIFTEIATVLIKVSHQKGITMCSRIVHSSRDIYGKTKEVHKSI